MFSGFDNIAEGLKRFSLDALQKDEEADEKESPKRTHAISDSPVQRPASVALEPVAEVTPANNRSSNEGDEWDWGPENPGRIRKLSAQARKHAAQRRSDARSEPSPTEALNISSSIDGHGTAPGSIAAARESPGEVHATLGDGHAREQRALEMSRPGRTMTPWNVKVPQLADQEEETKLSEQHDLGQIIASTTRANSASHQQFQEQGSAATMSEQKTHMVNGDGEVSTFEGVGTTVFENDGRALASLGAETEVMHVDSGGGGVSPVSPSSRSSHEQGDGGVRVAGKMSTDEGHGLDQAARADEENLRVAQRERSQANSTLLALQGALRDSQYEVARLRDMLSTQETKTRRQEDKIVHLSDEVNAVRIGFQESNEAHQRTAQRSHAVEQELDMSRRTIDTLRVDKAALKEQLDANVEDRKALEAQLRQLQAGLTEGQEAARQEARKEVERLEARLKEVMKDRDRKNAELELQNARRKETREMARDLESQLAAVDRTSQEREAELIKLRDEIADLKKNSGNATEERNTWATKYEALERNFKQVRAQSKKTEMELEQMRVSVGRIEAEKAALAERMEDEAAERVTVVASISHERNFLLRQVDRLEQEVTDLRRAEDAHATAAAARLQTTGELEEYRSRAQQALKRANEVTSQTVAENKRLEVEMAKLSAEVERQRPIWEQANRQEKLHLAELAELKEQLAIATTDRENKVADIASLQDQLAREEEERRATLASVVRLEAQGKSLKQEVQRQQKALAAAENREAALGKRLAEEASLLQATEDRENQQSAPNRTESIPGLPPKYPSSPLSASQSPSLGWDSDKLTPRNGNGTNSEAARAAWPSRLRSHGSSNSLRSDAEWSDAQPGSAAEQLFYVHQLRERMVREQVEMRSLISELEASRTKVDAQAAEQARLEKRLEAALLDKKRLEELDQGRNASVNLEYLKNCVVGCLRTSEPSEHARLLPVITTILKLSREEADIIAKNITARAQHQGSFGGSLPPPSKATTGTEAGATSGTRWWSTR